MARPCPGEDGESDIDSNTGQRGDVQRILGSRSRVGPGDTQEISRVDGKSVPQKG